MIRYRVTYTAETEVILDDDIIAEATENGDELVDVAYEMAPFSAEGYDLIDWDCWEIR